MTKRITVASNRIATPRPTPIIFISSIDKDGVARLLFPINTGAEETPWSLMLVFNLNDALSAN